MQPSLRARFVAPGGTIGRSADCTLVLPDEAKRVSRQHARLDISGAHASITCISQGSPLLIGGAPLHPGQSRSLAHLDAIVIAPYELVVEIDGIDGGQPAVRDTGAGAMRADDVRAIGERLADQHSALFGALPVTRPTTLLHELNEVQRRAMQAAAGAAGGEAVPSVNAASAAVTPPSAVLPGSQGGSLHELLLQLLVGAGLHTGSVPGRHAPALLTPELMRRLGALLRVSADGAVALLEARAMFRQAVQVEATMLSHSANNAVKLSASGAAAVAHLLDPQPLPGFVEPVAAMREAFDDLLAHQAAFEAGLRGALQGLVRHFDPQVLAERLSPHPVVDAMLPMARKARLWELFTELYEDVAGEARADFESLLGRGFAVAYEAQVARSRMDRDGSPGSADDDSGAAEAARGLSR